MTNISKNNKYQNISGIVNEIAKQEIDEPLNEFRENKILQQDNKKLDKDLFSRVKGHNLLGWCVVILVIIYFIEKYTGGSISPIAESIIEIIKLLIFSLTGFLFGKHSEER